MKHFPSVAIFVFVSWGCGARDPAILTNPTPSQRPSQPARNPRIPVEVSYPIIKDEEEYNAFSKKRIVEVRLNTRISQEVLTIAKAVPVLRSLSPAAQNR
jgi:hypothetical protein